MVSNVGILVLLLVFALQLNVMAYSVAPTDPPSDAFLFATTTENSNLSDAEVNVLAGSPVPALIEFYKAEVPSGEEGSLAGSYETVFSGDPNGGTITHTGGDIIDPTAWLIVKDGAHDPAQYLFRLDGWDGWETIVLSGFWEGTQGAISHISLYGSTSSPVPEPATVALLGIGLVGLAGAEVRRRRKKNVSRKKLRGYFPIIDVLYRRQYSPTNGVYWRFLFRENLGSNLIY